MIYTIQDYRDLGRKIIIIQSKSYFLISMQFLNPNMIR